MARNLKLNETFNNKKINAKIVAIFFVTNFASKILQKIHTSVLCNFDHAFYQFFKINYLPKKA